MVPHVPSGGISSAAPASGLRRGNEDHRRAVAAGGVRVQAVGLVGRVERLVPPVVIDDPNELTLCRDGIVALVGLRALLERERGLEGRQLRRRRQFRRAEEAGELGAHGVVDVLVEAGVNGSDVVARGAEARVGVAAVVEEGVAG